MVTRIGGFRRKTRHKLKKGNRERGKLSLSRFFRTFEVGAKVLLKAEPSVQKGLYFPRFHGQVGLVTGKKGACYEVQIKDGKKDKTLIVHPVHLKQIEQV